MIDALGQNVVDRDISGIMESKVDDKEFHDVFELTNILDEISCDFNMEEGKEVARNSIYQFESVCEAIVASEGENVYVKSYHREIKKLE